MFFSIQTLWIAYEYQRQYPVPTNLKEVIPLVWAVKELSPHRILSWLHNAKAIGTEHVNPKQFTAVTSSVCCTKENLCMMLLKEGVPWERKRCGSSVSVSINMNWTRKMRVLKWGWWVVAASNLGFYHPNYMPYVFFRVLCALKKKKITLQKN